MTLGLYNEPASITRDTAGGRAIVTVPAVEPIATADAKLFARVESSVTTDDGLFASLIVAARRAIEVYTDRAIMTQTWDWFLDEAPGEVLEIPLPPLQTITGIYFTDSDGTEGAAISSALYTVDVARNRVLLNDGDSWGYADLRSFRGTRVRFVAGYGATASDASVPTVGSAPAEILLACRRLVLEAYEGRGPEMPPDVMRLLSSFRKVRI